MDEWAVVIPRGEHECASAPKMCRLLFSCWYLFATRLPTKDMMGLALKWLCADYFAPIDHLSKAYHPAVLEKCTNRTVAPCGHVPCGFKRSKCSTGFWSSETSVKRSVKRGRNKADGANKRCTLGKRQWG